MAGAGSFNEGNRSPLVRGKYQYILTVLAAEVVLITALRGRPLLYFVGLSFILLLSIVAFHATHRRGDQFILLSLGLIAFVLNAFAINFPVSVSFLVFDNLLWIGFTGYLTYLIMRQIFSPRSVGLQEICGAVSGYLLTGILFTQVHEILLYSNPQAIYFDPMKFGDRTHGTGDVLYYSFMTLTTVGYGDVSPATPAARAVSLVESVTGIMYVAVLISRFVSLHSSPPRAPRQ